MSSQVTLPRLGQGMESGTIVRWLKAEGDHVEKGEVLYELDTEKATQEVEAEASGVLLKILAGEGEEIEVGTAIAVIGEEGEEVAEERAPEDASRGAEERRAGGGRAGAGGARRIGSDGRASRRRGPRVRARAPAGACRERRPRQGLAARAADRARAGHRPRRAHRHRPRGPHRRRGRRTRREGGRAAAAAPAAAAAAPPSGEVEVVPLTGMRKAIARRMTEAWQAPVFQIAMTADMTAAIRLREGLVARMGEGDAKPTYSDILTKVCAVALMRHRAVNALFAGEEVHLIPTANVGIAVAIPNGLVVPVLRNCETKTIPQLANERADLVARTRDGRLRQDDLEGGTFTISNLGMYGVERFVAVLNPPQAAILAVGAIEERAVVARGRARRAAVLELTLTLRPPHGGRGDGVRVPAHGQAVPRRAGPGPLGWRREHLVPRQGSRSGADVLLPEARLRRGLRRRGGPLGAPHARERRGGDRRGRSRGGEAVLTLDVADVKAEAERLREQGVQVGTVLEIPGTIRLLDVFDLDGNRLQLSQDL